MKKDCTTCRYAYFETRLSGRRNLAIGDCNVPIELPHSFVDLRRELPRKRAISKHTSPDCPLWEVMK